MDCGQDHPGWKLGPHMSTAYYYRYLSDEDYNRGVMPRITPMS